MAINNIVAKPGYIYLLSNSVLNTEAGEPIYKIGFATNLESRIKALSAQTAIPQKFKVVAHYPVHDMASAEILVHTVFSEAGLHVGKEFFYGKGVPNILKALFALSSLVNITPVCDIEDEPIKEFIPRTQANSKIMFSFAMVGIAHGSVITYKKDPDITCTVYSDNEVEFENKIWRLSAITKFLEKRRGTITKTGTYQGSHSWMFCDKTLFQLYKTQIKEMSSE